MRKHRIGVLGGTFNPIHCGHVDLGLRVREAWDLDEVYYMLSARPPHKQNRGVAAVSLRWKMLTVALESYPHLVPCDAEMDCDRPSWTVNTLDVLESRRPQDQFLFISGSEGFLKITTWKNYRRLLRRIPFIVVLRRPDHRRLIVDLAVREGITVIERNRENEENSLPCVYLFHYDSDKLGISSTLIRQRRGNGMSITSMVHPGVEKIILEENLYAA